MLDQFSWPGVVGVHPDVHGHPPGVPPGPSPALRVPAYGGGPHHHHQHHQQQHQQQQQHHPQPRQQRLAHPLQQLPQVEPADFISESCRRMLQYCMYTYLKSYWLGLCRENSKNGIKHRSIIHLEAPNSYLFFRLIMLYKSFV